MKNGNRRAPSSFFARKRFVASVRSCIAVTLVTLLALAPLISCSTSPAQQYSKEVVTQKPTEPGRQRISVLVKFAFSINEFEKIVEEKFPDIDLVQVGNYTSALGIEEYEARLKNNDLPDIVMTWPQDAGEEYLEDRLLDLSGMGFSDKYNLSTLSDMTKDNKLYYLPGPAEVRGIVYNKTLFEENGWEVPSDYDGFIELCKTIEASGIRSLQLGLENPEVLDTAFAGFGYADCFSKPQDKLWINAYNEGEGKFADHFMPALETFQSLIDNGILKPSDLDITYGERADMLFNRQCAMVEDSANLVRYGTARGCNDEFALMPFFNPGDGGDWARLYMVCYIGLSKELAKPQNAEKYDLVMKLMDYISTQDGQNALMADTGAMLSNLVGMDAPNVPEINNLQNALKHGRYGTFDELKNAQGTLREGLAGMVRGKFSAEEVAVMVDRQNVSPPRKSEPPVLGSAQKAFSLTETGSYVADAMKAATNSDIALIPDVGKDGRCNEMGVAARFYEGPLTSEDINRVVHGMKASGKGKLQVTQMTGSQIMETLEYSIKVSGVGGWFYYFSGLRMTFDPTAEPGSRVKEISLEDGSPLDLERTYTVAIGNDSIPPEFASQCENTGAFVEDAVKSAIAEQGVISPVDDGRFNIIQH